MCNVTRPSTWSASGSKTSNTGSVLSSSEVTSTRWARARATSSTQLTPAANIAVTTAAALSPLVLRCRVSAAHMSLWHCLRCLDSAGTADIITGHENTAPAQHRAWSLVSPRRSVTVRVGHSAPRYNPARCEHKLRSRSVDLGCNVLPRPQPTLLH